MRDVDTISRIELPYGHDTVQSDLEWGRCLGVLDIADVPEVGERDDAIRKALERPIGLAHGLFSIVRPGETVAILVSDQFRMTCAHQVLPILLDGLNAAGIPDPSILILFASGTHRQPNTEEQKRIVGPETFARMQGRLFTHEPDNDSMLTTVGTTSRGTVIEVNKRVHDCDRIVAIGACVMHYFGGFGGGRKSILPGICSARTIAHNHAMNLHPTEDTLNPAVRIAALDGNPVAEDMLEGARLVGVDFSINTVLNRRGEIAGIFAGELDAAHRAAAELAYSLYAVSIDRQADLVIASSPHTRNFVQTHKALYNAYQAMKPGGRIILLAPCPEGLGGEQFVKWVRLGTRDAVIAGLRKQSEINGQTALSTIEKAPSAFFITELSSQEVELLGGRKSQSLEAALSSVRESLPTDEPTYYLMPSAAYTVPFVSPAAVTT